MKRRVADILRDALTLPAEARAALAGQLLDSLDSHTEARRRQLDVKPANDSGKALAPIRLQTM